VVNGNNGHLTHTDPYLGNDTFYEETASMRSSDSFVTVNLETGATSDEENDSFFRVVETDLIYNQLEGNYLKIADRMSMKASIELRVPLLDEMLVNYAMILPVEYKINKGVSKYALRKLAENKLPKDVITKAIEDQGYTIGN